MVNCVECGKEFIEYLNETKCQLCFGSGYTDDLDSCPICNGSGVEYTTEKLQCKECLDLSIIENIKMFYEIEG